MTKLEKLHPTLDTSRPPKSGRQPAITATDSWNEVGYAPRSDCLDCGGAGFIHPVVNGQILYSQAVPCRAKGCLFDSMRRYRNTDLIVKAQGVTVPSQIFGNFRKVGGAEEAFKYAVAFASKDDITWFFLLIHGGVGNGKTHLCNAMAKKLIERGRVVRMTTSTALLGWLKASFNDHSVEAVLTKLKQVLVLIIDDLGVEYGTEWEKAKLEELITSRWANGMPTAITTNLAPEDLPPRIYSRFNDARYARIVANTAPDFRATRSE